MSVDGYISNSLGSYGVPQDMTNVSILFGKLEIFSVMTAICPVSAQLQHF